jgi:hypothetical protein
MKLPNKQRIQTWVSRGDSSALLTVLRTRMQTRRRDPFAVEDYIDFVEQGATGNPTALLELAELADRARGLVPRENAYLHDRVRLLFRATLLAIEAAEATGHDAFVNRDSELTRVCSVYAARFMSENSSDPNGLGRLLSAIARAHQGRLQAASESLESARPLLITNGIFHYVSARLSAVLLQPEKALESIRMAISCGFEQIRAARGSADFAKLPKIQRDRLQELLRVRYEWKPIPGVFTDDVVVTNNSAFPLTNVTFRVDMKSGGQMQCRMLEKLERLEPGASKAWANIMSDSASAEAIVGTLTCDQD